MTAQPPTDHREGLPRPTTGMGGMLLDAILDDLDEQGGNPADIAAAGERFRFRICAIEDEARSTPTRAETGLPAHAHQRGSWLLGCPPCFTDLVASAALATEDAPPPDRVYMEID